LLLVAGLFGCSEDKGGPIEISAIGEPPALRNPNADPLDPPSAILVEAVAQSLVRFEASGQIEPALAQRWIVSDDGLRYTFRLARAKWSGGAKVTAEQVASRLRAASARTSRNPLKPVLGAIEEIEAMTDDVLEITLKAPRPHFLQILAQPQMAVLREGQGSGPYVVRNGGNEWVTLRRPSSDAESGEWDGPAVRLRGERAALAVARFRSGSAEFVTGGTVGDLPVAQVARLSAQSLRFDPVAGLFGLGFAHSDGILGRAEIRAALSMAIDRQALVAALEVPDLQPRTTLVPLGIEELPAPTAPAWSERPLAARRAAAASAIAEVVAGDELRLRIAMPKGPGYRIILARLRRDWRTIGVQLEAVEEGRGADLIFVDSVAPSAIASWYLRSFSCSQSRVCSLEAEVALEQARNSRDAATRSQHLAEADRLLADRVVFIPLAAPVRWHLVSNRLNGFRTNAFARHAIGELVAAQR
jgi:peptide/nickel transport system substrate-binding protein